MLRKVIFLLALLYTCSSYSQYHFEGQLAENVEGNIVYLSIIEDYRKFTRVSANQIIKRTNADASGHFVFEGNNLSVENRIYRIHIDSCNDETTNSKHFFGNCENRRSILFVATNRDTISFPTSFADEALCEINSTNTRSSIFLEIDVMKEQMAMDFYDFPSEANRKLNAEKWFKTFQEFAIKSDEPLAELYMYDFLSDRQGETYDYYLKDVSQIDYYGGLAKRLDAQYPNSALTSLYKKEISENLKRPIETNPSNSNQKWIWVFVIAISLLLNVFFLMKRKKRNPKIKKGIAEKLTAQEQKIVAAILKDKTNKEIAAELFISLSTVKTHINNIYKKLGVSSRDEIKQQG